MPVTVIGPATSATRHVSPLAIFAVSVIVAAPACRIVALGQVSPLGTGPVSVTSPAGIVITMRAFLYCQLRFSASR